MLILVFTPWAEMLTGNSSPGIVDFADQTHSSEQWMLLKCRGCIYSAVPSNSTVCFKECVFPSRLWQEIGTLCIAHLTPNVIILHGNEADVPGYSWHGNEAKHLHKGRGSGHIQKVQDATHDVIPFICISLWCGWLQTASFLHILQRYLWLGCRMP